jgi:GT2 family glycosyltransferase
MISLIVVNYRTAALTAEAVRSARASSSVPLQAVVVDNSEDANEAAALEGVADRLVIAPSNRGYAGGANLGRRACDGETIIVANPDVIFGSRAVDLLVEALSDAAVAGPAFFWDSGHRWMLPPGDLGTASEKVDQILATRSPGWLRKRDRRRFRRRIAFWSLQQPASVQMLSGAVLAFRAEELDRAGGFDERFPLYFEEADLLRRIAATRRRIVYVPSARCRHLYNQSASQVPEEAAARYAASELRYLEKWNGPFAARFLKKLERPLAVPEPPLLEGPLELDRDDTVVEISPLASFTTAAGHFPETHRVEVPAEIRASARGPLYIRSVVRATGDVLGTYRISS